MALPLSMLRGLHVRSIDKWGLAAVFLLAIVDTLFDIIRTITTLRVVANVIEIVAAMEPPMAVIISALAALGPVLQRRSRSQKSSGYWSGNHVKSWSGSHIKSGSRSKSQNRSHLSSGRRPIELDGEELLDQDPKSVRVRASPLELDPHRDTVATRVFVDPVYVQRT